MGKSYLCSCLFSHGANVFFFTKFTSGFSHVTQCSFSLFVPFHGSILLNIGPFWYLEVEASCHSLRVAEVWALKAIVILKQLCDTHWLQQRNTLAKLLWYKQNQWSNWSIFASSTSVQKNLTVCSIQKEFNKTNP